MSTVTVTVTVTDKLNSSRSQIRQIHVKIYKFHNSVKLVSPVIPPSLLTPPLPPYLPQPHPYLHVPPP